MANQGLDGIRLELEELEGAEQGQEEGEAESEDGGAQGLQLPSTATGPSSTPMVGGGYAAVPGAKAPREPLGYPLQRIGPEGIRA